MLILIPYSSHYLPNILDHKELPKQKAHEKSIKSNNLLSLSPLQTPLARGADVSSRTLPGYGERMIT